jgi:hypothetical protein
MQTPHQSSSQKPMSMAHLSRLNQSARYQVGRNGLRPLPYYVGTVVMGFLHGQYPCRQSMMKEQTYFGSWETFAVGGVQRHTTGIMGDQSRAGVRMQ